MKKRKLSRDDIKAAFRGLPRIQHDGAERIAPEVLDAFHRCFREAVLDRGTLTKTQWKLARGNGNGPHRTEAIEALIHSAFQRLDPQLILEHFPPCSVGFVFQRNVVRMQWERLVCTEVDRRLVYHFPDRPRINLFGGEWVPGFTNHALIQLADRFAVNETTGRITLARLLRGCEPEPHEDKLGFWLWANCNTVLTQRIASILTDTETPADCQFRLAYCPAHFLGKFLRASTILPPAFLIDGINEALLSFSSLANYKTRNWHELIKLDQKLPMIRQRPKPATCFGWEPQRVRIHSSDDSAGQSRSRQWGLPSEPRRDRGEVSRVSSDVG